MENQIAQDPNHFGYNETTKQFVQPPTIGRPEFTAYASRSTTGPTIYGLSYKRRGYVACLQIEQQLITQQYTSQTTAGGQVEFPVAQMAGNPIQLEHRDGLQERQGGHAADQYFYYPPLYTHGNNATTPPTIAKNTIAIPGVQTYPSLKYTPFFWGGLDRARIIGARPDAFRSFGAILTAASRWWRIGRDSFP